MSVNVRLSEPAAQFLRGVVKHLNEVKKLPQGDAEALATSAWLEEIEAAVARALEPETGQGRAYVVRWDHRSGDEMVGCEWDTREEAEYMAEILRRGGEGYISNVRVEPVRAGTVGRL